MDKNGQAVPVPDIRDYPANRNKFPWEELEKHRGHYVAFSLDGKQILASGPDRQTLRQEMLKQNLLVDQVVIDYLDA